MTSTVLLPSDPGTLGHAAQSDRGDQGQHPSGGRWSRSSGTRGSRLPRMMPNHPPRRRRLPERAAAGVRSGDADTICSRFVSTSVEVCGAAARRLDRRRHDPVDRVPARHDRIGSCRASASSRKGRWRRWRSSPTRRSSRSGRSPPTRARGRRMRCCASCAASGSASTRSSCRWRPDRRRCCSAATRRSSSAIPRCFWITTRCGVDEDRSR